MSKKYEKILCKFKERGKGQGPFSILGNSFFEILGRSEKNNFEASVYYTF
jgi:hypothetical protein